MGVGIEDLFFYRMTAFLRHKAKRLRRKAHHVGGGIRQQIYLSAARDLEDRADRMDPDQELFQDDHHAHPHH